MTTTTPETAGTPASQFVGKALYLEFRKGVNTAQIIITPEGLTTTGEFVPSSSWRRQISAWSPKKPWKCYANGETSARKEYADLNKELQTAHNIATAEALAGQMLNTLTPVLNLLHLNDWELLEKPIVLDFSQEDLANTKDWETPSALVRRILRARKELGFPEELLEQPAE